MPNKIELQLQKLLELQKLLGNRSSEWTRHPTSEYRLAVGKFILELCDVGVWPIFINDNEITFIGIPPWADEDEISLDEVALRSVLQEVDGGFVDLYVDWPLFLMFTLNEEVELVLSVELELL